MEQNKKNATLCFTGHRVIRSQDQHLEAWLMQALENLIRRGYRYFGAGGARGFDMIAAQQVIALKQQYPHIHLILALPFWNQYEKEQGWSREEIERYHWIIEKASKTVYIGQTYAPGCYYARNRHLVDHSSLCLCYQYKNNGGTHYTTEYARQKGVPVIRCLQDPIPAVEPEC